MTVCLLNLPLSVETTSSLSEPRYKPPPLCGKKGGGHKNVRLSKTLRCVSQRKLARKQNSGISMRKLALWPRKWCVSGGVSNSLRPCEMKDLFSTAQMSSPRWAGFGWDHWGEWKIWCESSSFGSHWGPTPFGSNSSCAREKHIIESNITQRMKRHLFLSHSHDCGLKEG